MLWVNSSVTLELDRCAMSRASDACQTRGGSSSGRLAPAQSTPAAPKRRTDHQGCTSAPGSPVCRWDLVIRDPGRTRQWPAPARQPCRSDTRPPHVRCTPPSLCRFPSGLRSSRQGTKRWYALVMAWRRRRSVVGEAEVAPDPSGAHAATRGIGPPLHVVEQGVQFGERATALGHGLARRATTEGGELLVRPPLLVLAHELVQQHGGLLRWESLGREGRLAGLPVLVASGLRIPSALRQELLHRHDRLRHQLGPWSGGQHPLLQVAEPLDRVGLYGQAAFQAIDRPADHALAVVELVYGEQPVRPLVLELGGEPVQTASASGTS